MKTLLLLFGIFFLSVLLGSAEGKMVAFVNFVVRHSFVPQSNGITDMTVAAAFKPHEISETISGTNLWRLGFFGARNMEGTGPRANEIHQLLSPAQRSQTAFPGQNLTFDASSRVNLNNIGPDQSFPFYCVEFAKNPLADPDFTFQVANDEVPAILCQNSQSLPRSAPEQETRPSALFTSVITRFQITRSPDDTIPSRATITVTLEPNPRTDVITGTNLWQLGFFGSRNSDGSGERKNESPQLLLPVQASQPLHPNEPFVLSVERLVNMAGIAGTDESFPYVCVEFGKQPTASPDFLFLGSDEGQTIVLCENARETEQVPDAFPVDTTRPQILECPDIDAPSVIAIVELGITSAIVPFNEPTATDASNSITVDSSCNSGDRYPVGTTTCTFTFTDSSGNRDQCVFTITVLTEDTTPPEVFQCPDEVTAIVELGITSIVMLYDEPFATDNSNATNLLQNQTCQPGGSYPVGETSCLYLFVDPDGNKNSCIFLIKVTTSDQTRPTISNCPTAGPSTIVELGLLYGVVLWTEPTATDLAGATLLPRTGRPGDSFPLGNTPIVYVFTDPSGNEATCTFIVTVTTEDTTPPMIVNCPSLIERQVELGVPGLIITWTEPSATDISGTAMLVNRTHAPNDFFPVGITQVIYNFTDSSQNEAVCSFMISITTDPILIEFTTNDLKVQEDIDDVTINLNLNQINDREDLTISFRIRETNPASATSGKDFREETVSTTVPIGSQVASVTVRVLDDDQRERTETFVVEIDETTLPENVQVDGQNFITIHIEDSDCCSNEYFEMGEVCYRKVIELLNFDEAREVCQQDGAELASVSTPSKNSIVSDIANGQRCWVGAVVHGDEYTWLNGDPWSFSNWRKGGPNWPRRPLRACIETNFVRPTLWNDNFCHAKRLSVCEKPLLPEPET